MIPIISLGAGVQSSTMALMAAHGEIKPMPQRAIFADTGAEPRTVYDWLEKLESWLPFPVDRVMQGNGLKANLRRSIEDFDSLRGKRRGVMLPVFTKAPEDFTEGRLPRQCTEVYKLDPLRRRVREVLGYEPRKRIPAGSAVMWLGISTDEMARANPSRVKWIENRFPLIEKGISRQDCLAWMARNNYPQPPRSACTFCPYHSDAEWRNIRDNDPEAWSEALEVDAMIRGDGAGICGIKKPIYLHRSCQPLVSVDFSTAEDRGQLNLFSLNDCVGMCGT